MGRRVQINWNWLYNYSKNGQTFIDLNSVSEYLDLTQWDEAKLAACNVANAQQCVPVSMTGRIFYWNKTTFDKAGISFPTTLDELMATMPTRSLRASTSSRAWSRATSS